MSDLLKNNYNKKYISLVASEVQKQHCSFKAREFTNKVLDKDWEDLELKSRMRKITVTLKEFLPNDYFKSIEIILKAAPPFGGFEGMFFADFVEQYGQEKENWNLSLNALKELTKYSSSEFAIRPFIIKDSKRVMKTLLSWSRDKNFHVRRLASEGCRPRLPWAMAIKDFKVDPSQIIPILENLKNDPELYVRRSVANNLNDISKDHPELVVKIAKSWIGENQQVDWVVKHGLRTLLKRGNQKALKIFGFAATNEVKVSKVRTSSTVKIGKELEFEFTISNSNKSKLRIEYGIDYLKMNGSHSRKVFKISENEFQPGRHRFVKKQSFKEMTTRKHHPGKHFLCIIINGVSYKSYGFNVL
ncbi:DNA alkylation repair protein [Halobacteriovorax sp. HLS]|uniref:DNA alkylation repair protein n=1 Tax=Halobacteriovorax sp. HLS TaxID=2234000 RepID=UPI000FDA2F14|nr:DNA alkylation repair protein [Halobacteriovorax sp. HLS]